MGLPCGSQKLIKKYFYLKILSVEYAPHGPMVNLIIIMQNSCK